jgi:hypothetical protein
MAIRKGIGCLPVSNPPVIGPVATGCCDRLAAVPHMRRLESSASA